ncbi:hypothetical protein KAR91_15985 [Candidatus Pacearchaeota archaeon]|nr:hypothetical protein [Candidatus Pacearchaeota archaeon]
MINRYLESIQYVNYYPNYSEIQMINEQVDILLEKVNDSDLPKLKNATSKNINLIHKVLNQYGITKNYIALKVKTISNKIENGYKQGIEPKKLSLILSKELTRDFVNLTKKIKEKVEEKVGEKTVKIVGSIIIGILLFYLIVVLHGFLARTLSGVIVDSDIVHNIMAMLIAPFTEEAIKAFGIHIKQPWIITGVVFGLEFFKYLIFNLSKALSVGYTMTSFTIGRLLGLAFHFFTTWIQRYLNKLLTGDETKFSFTSYLVAVFLHVIMNSFGNRVIAGLLMKPI